MPIPLSFLAHSSNIFAYMIDAIWTLKGAFRNYLPQNVWSRPCMITQSSFSSLLETSLSCRIKGIWSLFFLGIPNFRQL